MLLNLPQCAGQPLPQIITSPDLSIVPRLRNPKLNERLNMRGELKGLEIQANKKSILPNTQEGGREWDSSWLILKRKKIVLYPTGRCCLSSLEERTLKAKWRAKIAFHSFLCMSQYFPGDKW